MSGTATSATDAAVSTFSAVRLYGIASPALGGHRHLVDDSRRSGRHPRRDPSRRAWRLCAL